MANINGNRFGENKMSNYMDRNLAEAEDIARIENGKLLINWKLFLNAYHWPDYYREGYYSDLVKFLISLNIFSLDSKNNYEILDKSYSRVKNPQYQHLHVYFTRLHDVLEFMKEAKIDTNCNWEVRQIHVLGRNLGKFINFEYPIKQL